MKKAIKKPISLLLVAAILLTTLLIAPISASAADTPVKLEGSSLSIWADPENVLSQTNITDFNSGNKLAVLGGITPHKVSTSSTTYYLFLPSTADCTALKFWFSGTASINGTALTSGEPTDALASINEGGASLSTTFTIDGSSYSVTAIKSGDVATVYIDTESGSLSTITGNALNNDHSGEEPGSIMVVQPNGDVDYMGVMEKMSGRGNGTWDYSNTKNPYNIKLAKSTSLLGMGAAKKWCLLANAGDSSLVKNQLTYDFAKYIGIKYQPTCKPCDLYVNQQYLGSYQLSEKVEIKSNRIDVTDAYENLEIANGTTDPTTGIVVPADLSTVSASKYDVNGSAVSAATTSAVFGQTVGSRKYATSITDPTDYTGGYLYELEISNRWYEENAGFCAYNRQGWVIKSCDVATKNMTDYSYDLLYALGSAVYNGGNVPTSSTQTQCSSAKTVITAIASTGTSTKTITNPAPASQYQGKRWSSILDADSAVRYYWTQEYFKNMDSSTSSTYFYKDSDSIDSMLYAGPMWDMDNSIGYGLSGSRWGYSWTSSEGWYTKYTRIYRWRCEDSTTTYSSDSEAPLSFYAALANCADFWSMAEDYWYAYISPAVEIIRGEAVDETGVLKSAAEYINAIAKSGYMDAVRLDINSSSYDAQSHITNMTTWFTERQNWINTQIAKTNMSEVNVYNIADQTFTGSEITPSPVVTYYDSYFSNITLVEGRDYTVSYADNTNVGTATVTVTGINGYEGTKTATFNIVAGSLSDYTLTIDSAAYKESVINASLINANGDTVSSGASYQWYKDGVAIDGATDSSYTVAAEDAGSVLTVTATGDGTNLTGSVTSNECTVLEGERPTSYSKTIASWDYDYTADSAALETADPNAAEYYYLATSGENQSTSTLYASVNATDHAKIKWSDTADLYVNDAVTDLAPVMGTSKTDLLAWGEWPYFETVVSTAGYENIKFSAKLGGTKKAPRDWKLQYSLDGITYTDIEGAAYSITDNKVMEQAFDNVLLPSECENQLTVYIRMVVTNDIAINGTNTVINQISGDAAVNNIRITGASLSVITELYAPTITPESGTALFDDTLIEIADNNGGADVYYTVNGSEPVLYTSAFSPFDEKTAKVGDAVSITAYARFNDITSEEVNAEYTFAGVDIINFSYDTYSTNVTSGAVQSTGGVYDQSGKMTAYADDQAQYVPLWRDDNKSFCVAPDDGLKWSENSGFTYKISTAGYENINFSAMAYTTELGPKSVTLQYSEDNINFYNVQSNVELTANGVLEQAFLTVELPAACDNKEVLYIRLATTENLTFGGLELHNSESKGNLYVNNVIIGGEDMGTLKMPYTNKSTSYFGANGIIHYTSPDGENIQYIVFDKNNKVVQNGTYNDLTGIQLSTVNNFNPYSQDPYTVLVWAGDDDDQSLVNMKTYYYKGDTVVEFDYNGSTNLFSDYVSSDSLSASSTAGVNSGTLSMYPNATDAALLSYTGTYGVKVAWDTSNPFTATKKINEPNGNGYWLIETSTKGYTNLTLNLEQLSSNKGPRDWGVAYSLDGISYNYVDKSNARAISNDVSSDTVETYGNLSLPAACDNLDTLYIKIFINGGESIDSTELELVTKGNTGINNIELSGIKIPEAYSLTVNTTVLEAKDATEGTIPFGNVDVYVNGVLKGTTDSSGVLTLDNLVQGSTYDITFSGNNIVERTITKTASANEQINVPVLIFDVNGDGYINAKDYAVINKDSSYASSKQYFENFINCKTSEFSYK
ncbi:MAG: CotH kinase family protein [Eubacterium sp.]